VVGVEGHCGGVHLLVIRRLLLLLRGFGLNVDYEHARVVEHAEREFVGHARVLGQTGGVLDPVPDRKLAVVLLLHGGSRKLLKIVVGEGDEEHVFGFAPV